jgi:hypothetical protein
MEKRESSAAAVAAFENLGADLLDAGAVAGQMFGARSLLLDKKALACLNGDAVAFKDWVEIPLAAAEEWPSLADAALANARQ